MLRGSLRRAVPNTGRLSAAGPRSFCTGTVPLESSRGKIARRSNELVFYVNGKRVAVDARTAGAGGSLLNWLRNDRGLTGTKQVCNEGGCGACTVLMSRWRPGEPGSGDVYHTSVAACLTPLPFIDGTSLWTVEGLRKKADKEKPRGGSGDLHPVQRALVQSHATQCGYCTPGFAMSYAAQLAQNNAQSSCAQLEHALDGNLCRCTGYRPILDAGKLLAADEAPSLSLEQKRLRKELRAELESIVQTSGELFPFPAELKRVATIVEEEEPALRFVDQHGALWLRPTSLAELLNLKAEHPRSTTVAGSHSYPYEGASEPQLSKLVSGFTDVGYKPNRAAGNNHDGRKSAAVFVSTTAVRELQEVSWEHDGVWLGGGTTINQVAKLAKSERAMKLPEYERRALDALFHQTRFFANNQVRDMGTVAGSLVNCSQVSDMVPAMIALKASVELSRLTFVNGLHKVEKRIVPIERFVLDDRLVDIKDDEVLTRVFVPTTTKKDHVLAFKQGHKRRLDSMAVLSSTMRLTVSSKIEDAILCFGGLGVSGIRAKQTEELLRGREFSAETFEQSCNILRAEIPSLIASSRHPDRATREYQGSLILGNWLKMWAHVDENRGGERTSPLNATEIQLTSANTSFAEAKHLHSSSQDYALAPTMLSRPDEAVEPGHVYDSAIHVNAVEQATGEARYVADYGLPSGGFHAALVTARFANARIKSIGSATSVIHKLSHDTGNEDIHFFSAADVPGNNMVPGFRPNDDEPVFAVDRVKYHGQPVGIVVAREYDLARKAASLIADLIEYDDIRAPITDPLAAAEAVQRASDRPAAIEENYFSTKPVYSMRSVEESLTGSSFMNLSSERSADRVLERGNARAILDNIREREANGDSSCGVCTGTVDLLHGQYAFYLETQNCLVLPSQGSNTDRPSFHIHASTQAPSNITGAVTAALGLPHNSVVCRSERVGGGFGGKQTRGGLLAAAAAIPSYHLNSPVKLQLSRSEDMEYCPGRTPFYATYSVAWERDTSGAVKICALQADLATEGGYSQDYTVDVLETAMFVLDGGYELPFDITIAGRVAKTNKGSHTATRGFGKPQAAAIIECIVDDVAAAARIDPVRLREQMLYSKGATTLTNMTVGDDVLRMCWNGIVRSGNGTSEPVSGQILPPSGASYDQIRKHCDLFNASNKWIKRGVAVTPSKGNMGFVDCPDVNRGLALMHAQKDGSISITHSGVEMGQGLATRLMQVAASSLGIPASKIRILETDTFAVPNTPPTTMVSTDLAGSAVQQCADRLKAHLSHARNSAATLLGREPSWEEICSQGYDEGAEMTVTGSTQYPTLVYDWQKQTGDISYFFVWGAAMSIVELDVITGSWRILRTDILQDCGQRSLNPALDVGQVEGGFIYGIGYYCQEEMVYDSLHKESFGLFSNNVAKYKLPTHDDIPQEWNVKLLRYDAGDSGGDGVYGTKGIGEANIGLALSAYLGIKDAMRAARTERGMDPRFELKFPSTAENVRSLLKDDFSYESQT